MRKQLAAFAVLGLAAGAAHADPAAPQVDVYYVPLADIEASVSGVGSDGDHGDGFGARAAMGVLDWLVVNGEYQANGYQDFDDLTQYRVGATLVGSGALGLAAEYIVVDDAFEAEGFGVHLRFAGDMVYGQFGYVQLKSDDLDDSTGGYEFTLGALIPLSDAFKGFVDVRRTGIGRDGSAFEIETADVRAGVRFTFGQGEAGVPAEPSEPVEVIEPAE
jgi:hypothetical protein